MRRCAGMALGGGSGKAHAYPPNPHVAKNALASAQRELNFMPAQLQDLKKMTLRTHDCSKTLRLRDS